MLSKSGVLNLEAILPDIQTVDSTVLILSVKGEFVDLDNGHLNGAWKIIPTPAIGVGFGLVFDDVPDGDENVGVSFLLSGLFDDSHYSYIVPEP